MNYYKKQLNKLNNYIDPIAIKLVDADGNETNFFDLNEDSYNQLCEFINEVMTYRLAKTSQEVQWKPFNEEDVPF